MSFQALRRVVSAPGCAGGEACGAAVTTMDLAPTFAELCAGERMAGVDGRSFAALLGSPGDEWPDEAFAEFHGQRFFYTQRILWRGSWKYVFNGFDVDELYDLAADPHETRNLAAEAECAEVLEEMSRRMWEIMRATGDHNMFNAQYPMFRFAPTGPEG